MESQAWIGFLRHTENINMTSSHVTLKRIGKKMAMAKENFLNTITNVLALSVKQHKVLSDDEWDTISTIINLEVWWYMQVFHNQVQVENQQRRRFLWRPKDQVLTDVVMVGHKFDPRG